MIFLIETGQWKTLLTVLVWVVCARQDWLEAMSRQSDNFYVEQVKKAVGRYKAKIGLSEIPTSNMVGYKKYLDSIK